MRFSGDALVSKKKEVGAENKVQILIQNNNQDELQPYENKEE